MSLLGIDVGTAGCKAAIHAPGRGCLAEAYREYETLHARPGWAELDAYAVMDKVKESIAEAVSKSRDEAVTALSISCMGEAMTPVSADREILGNAILGVDLRGAKAVDRLAEEMGQEAFYAINPNILSPNYSLPALMWLKDNKPGLYGRTWKFLLWQDLVAFMLGAEAMTSHSLANRTLLFDIHREDWSSTLLDWAGLEGAKLPKTVPSGTQAGEVAGPVARELGLPAGVPIFVGGHDQCCNALGAGIHAAGQAVCGIGTVECITPTYAGIPEAAPMLERRLNVEHTLLEGIYASFIYNQSGLLVRWFRDTFAQAEQRLCAPGQDLFDRLAVEMPAAPTSLLVLPHFEPTGAPDFIPDSAGVIAGLKDATTRGEILKAMMEGATYYFVDSIQALRELDIDTSEFIATGGGAKSDAWLQIKADIFGVPFVRPKTTECSALGAAMLAGIASGVFASPKEAAETMVHRDRVFEPNAERHDIYAERYQQYRRLYPALKNVLAELNSSAPGDH